MTRGTTCTHTFDFGFALPTLTTLYATYYQSGAVIVEKALAAVVISADRTTVTVELSQADTLLFTADKRAQVQIRYKDSGNKAYATKKMDLVVNAVFKEGAV